MTIRHQSLLWSALIILDRAASAIADRHSPRYQRKGVGRLLDTATQQMVKAAGTGLFIRIHEHIVSIEESRYGAITDMSYQLPFYLEQGYTVLASPVYTFEGIKPFKVHFLAWPPRED